MDVVIIGAGLSGLATAAALAAQGISHVILDQAEAVASAWRQRHPQLRLNTHRCMSQLPGARYPAGTGSFPHRDDLVQYLVSYAATLGSPLALGTQVRSIDKAGGWWRVQTRCGSRLAPHLVVATGRDRLPWRPAWPGLATYRGRLLHAADFGEASQYAGQSVLVVGGGNSAIDILNHLARVPTGPLWLAVRRPPTLLPLRANGIPLQPSTALLRRLPVRGQDLALRATQWLFYRDLRRFGLAAPGAGGATRLHGDGVVPAIDDGFAAALRQGRIAVLPEPVAFGDHGVRLADGTSVQPDVVIAATGYRAGLQGLVGHLGVLGADGLPRIPCGRADLAHPGLWFVGMRPDPAGYFRAARDAAARIAWSIARGQPG